MDIHAVNYLSNVQSVNLSPNTVKNENKKESTKTKTDSIIISEEARKFSEKENVKDQIAEQLISQQEADKIAEKKMLAEQLKSQLEENVRQSEQMMQNAKNMIDGTKEQLKAMELAMKIYKRMSKGDRVSQDDEKTLMDYSFTLFMTAKMEQMMAEKHEDMTKDSLTKKYSENDTSSQTDMSIDMPDIQVSETAAAEIPETDTE